MSNSIVRLAFEGSVANTAPPVSSHTTHASTVPSARSGPAATPPSPSSHAILVAEKYGSSTSPVRSRTSGRCPAAVSSAQRSAVRRSCQTMARCRGRPVRRSQATTVSRWLVTPMAAMGPFSSVVTPASVARTAAAMSSGSCSTHPGRG
jgi:hypothetical protein